jgi:hypothetical protein
MEVNLDPFRMSSQRFFKPLMHQPNTNSGLARNQRLMSGT